MKPIILLVCVLWSLYGYSQDFKQYSSSTLDSIYKYYGVGSLQLFREHYPFDENYKADYLVTDAEGVNIYSYLWPFSGGLSAQVARYELESDVEIKEHIEKHVLIGLGNYYDMREPFAYASYINTAKTSDRFYDDNIWIGIDFVDMYMLTGDETYLEKGRAIWTFIESGTDDKLGGGIYWCEQRKESKNTCSNAPGSVLALKLYQATKENKFLEKGKALYHWTQEHLQDTVDHLYYDNINLQGYVDKTKYSYNSGQMIQAASLLYLITGKQEYKEDAQRVASASYDFFFDTYHDTDYPRFKSGNLWFNAIMLRGFIELYHIDGNADYLHTFCKNMEFAWQYMRDGQGLFDTDWSLQQRGGKKWLLNQFAMVEMQARLAATLDKIEQP
ncbi:glycoside hydrolase family 76 protein [Sphingobacterium wenxiniae]|uniref:Glycosyl hydrolase family 76 n=1 Tax=Sphingobacterium wenxiniae TaxID=683125 RepID=A0A1I6TUS2_9SPHI|nr:glycoside hydrolase family 76 protein [Sphingobacterium wenxiniae]SFS92914.1 Glycosyl hydrolase family 76 [Sphingobacterium wenxiniae]